MAIALDAQITYISIDMRAKTLILGLILSLTPLSSREKANVPNPWQELFTEPVEIAYVIMKDWTTFTYTSQLENEVYISMGKLEERLKKFKGKNYSIKDIAIIIHNHITDYQFSPRDYKVYRRLKKRGFQGLFLLYSHMTNKIYDIEGGNR